MGLSKSETQASIWTTEKTLAVSLWLLLLTEIFYWVGVRTVLKYFPWDTWEAETIRTAFRIFSFVVAWSLLSKHVKTWRSATKSSSSGVIKSPLFVIACLAFPLAAVLVPHSKLDPSFALVFCLSSVFVGLKEEFLFRGIVQNILSTRIGRANSLLVTSVVFAVWHVGVVPNSLTQYFEIFIASIFLGSVYLRTSNIWLCVGLHTVYDMGYSLPSLLPRAGSPQCLTATDWSVVFVCNHPYWPLHLLPLATALVWLAATVPSNTNRLESLA